MDESDFANEDVLFECQQCGQPTNGADFCCEQCQDQYLEQKSLEEHYDASDRHNPFEYMEKEGWYDSFEDHPDDLDDSEDLGFIEDERLY